MNELNYPFQQSYGTSFQCSPEKIGLARLCGLQCGLQGRDEGPVSARGQMLIQTHRNRYEADDFLLRDVQPQTDRLQLVWQTRDGGVQLESHWTFDPQTGIAARSDRLTNRNSKPVTLRQCLARFVFTPGFYQLYSQDSRWCFENQGVWQDLTHGRFILRSEQARSCLGASPYLFLRDKEQQRAVAFHLLPMGNWTIRVSSQSDGSDVVPFAVVELGLETENLSFTLAAGESLDLPQILIQSVPDNQPHLAAPRLHRYLLKHQSATNKPFAPVIYNTWFDQFEILNPDRLRKQLDAAKEIGCEVFVIDAGWYGQEKGSWADQTGDWREKLDGAFAGKMADFADEVRAAGLGFGLWMEPERIGSLTPIYREHPEWFFSGPLGYFPNLTDPAIYDYIRGQIYSVIERYRIVWLKIDFNNRLGIDVSGTEFYGYYRAWYRMMDELREKYPQVFIENCGSGGMRLDLTICDHFDGHFLSDTANPIDMLRISQGAMLRLLPGRITKWAGLRSIGGGVIPHYGQSSDGADERFVTPDGPVWDTPVVADLNFILRTSMTGMLGFTGDLINLSPKARAAVAREVSWYKTRRAFLASSICHLLTPPQRMSDREGWAAFQFQSASNTESLLFAFRLVDTRAERRFYPRNLDEAKTYRVRNLDQTETKTFTGAQLMTEGIGVALHSCLVGIPAVMRSAIVEIVPE